MLDAIMASRYTSADVATGSPLDALSYNQTLRLNWMLETAYEKGRLAGIHEEQQRAIAARGVALSRKATDTQQQAALMAFPKSGSLRRLVYEYIKYRWAKGSTDDELEEALGLSHQTVSARRRELVIGGFVVDSGERRNTRRGTKAIVWTLESLEEADSVPRDPAGNPHVCRECGATGTLSLVIGKRDTHYLCNTHANDIYVIQPRLDRLST